MLRLAARLPDPLVRLAPDRGRALRLRLDQRPEDPRQPLAAAGMQQHPIKRGAEHPVLARADGAVAEPDRMRAGVFGELLPERLGQITTTIDPVHDLQRAVLVAFE